MRKATMSTKHRDSSLIERLENRRLFSLGGLDPTFGVGGVVTDTTVATATAIVALPNGDTLVAATTTLSYSVNQVYTNQVYVLRYLPDGAVDSSFAGGKLSIVIGANTTLVGMPRDTLGNLLVGVTSSDGFSIHRFNGDGVLDTSFAKSGVLDRC